MQNEFQTATERVLDKALFNKSVGLPVSITPDQYTDMFRSATDETATYQTAAEKELEAQTGAVITATEDISQRLDKVEAHIEQATPQLQIISGIQATLSKLTTSVDASTLNELQGAIAALTAQLEASQSELSQTKGRVQELETEVTTDRLTGAKNRAALEKKLDQLEESKTPCTVIQCDLNFFKVINDTFGHSAGDEVLQVFTQRMQSHLKSGTNHFYRAGGDEFVVILEGMTDQTSIDKITRRLKLAVSNDPVSLAGKDVPLSSSMGAAVCKWDVPNARVDAFNEADKALYVDKESRERAAVKIELERLSISHTGKAKGFRV